MTTPTSLRGRVLACLVAGVGTVLTSAVLAAPAHAAAATIDGPNTAASGSLAVFSGDGWPAYATTNLYLVRNAAQTLTCSLHADSAGVIAPQTCAIPTFLATASYTVHADDAHGHTADATGALALTPSTALTSTFNNAATHHVAAGSTVSVSGHGFAPGSDLSVKVGTTPVTTTPASPLTDTNGSFGGVVFAVPAGQASGQVLVKVTDGSAHSATSAVQVYRAAISGKPGAAAGAPYLISGAGYPAADTVNVYLNHSGTNTFVCSVHTDDAGAFATQSCTVPSFLPAGPYALLASDSAVTVSQPFALSSSVVALSTFNNQTTPAVADGSTLALAGHGFAVSSALTVKVGTTTLTTTPAPAVTDANGSFSSVIVSIPTTTPATKQTITVKDAANNSATYKLYAFKAKVTGPAAGAAGSVQLLGGTGWPPVGTINAYLHVGTTNVFLCTLHGDANGVIATQSCAMPNSVPAGNYAILLSDGFVTATKAFTMQSAIAVTGSGGQPLAGGSVGTAANLAGSGFTASSTVSAKLGTKTINLVPATPSTTANGSFSAVTFAVPNVAAGTYALTVTDAANKKASVQFTVS